jgi:hypothetical protein
MPTEVKVYQMAQNLLARLKKQLLLFLAISLGGSLLSRHEDDGQAEKGL